MIKEIFEKLCEDNDITWNDKIIITTYNPFKKWYKFREPKFYKINGYLMYHEGDEIVTVFALDEDEEWKTLNFDFDKILNIEKYENL